MHRLDVIRVSRGCGAPIIACHGYAQCIVCPTIKPMLNAPYLRSKVLNYQISQRIYLNKIYLNIFILGMDLAEYAKIYLNIYIRGMRITKIIHPKVTKNGIYFEYYFLWVWVWTSEYVYHLYWLYLQGGPYNATIKFLCIKVQKKTAGKHKHIPTTVLVFSFW